MAAPINDHVKEKLISTTERMIRNPDIYTTHVSVETITHNTGTAKSTFFYYFKSKDEILLSVLKNYYKNRNQNIFGDMISENLEIDVARTMIKNYLVSAANDRAFLMFYLKIANGENGAYLSEIKLAVRYEYEKLQQIFGRHFERKKAEYLAKLTRCLYDGIVLQLTVNDDLDVVDFIDKFCLFCFE